LTGNHETMKVGQESRKLTGNPESWSETQKLAGNPKVGRKVNFPGIPGILAGNMVSDQESGLETRFPPSKSTGHAIRKLSIC